MIYKSVIKMKLRTHWIALHVNGNNIIYFDFYSNRNSKILWNNKYRIFMEYKNIIPNIYIIHTYNSIMCGYFYTGFINFMLKGKKLLDYRNHFLLIIMRRMIK